MSITSILPDLMEGHRPKRIVLMRHCERLDRAMEKHKRDWISTAPRPQDPPLSEHGAVQAALVAEQMKGLGIEQIYVSPLIRTVQTGHIIAKVLGLGSNSLLVEPGVIEEDRSFRGKNSPEPLPTWDPLLLSVQELAAFSDKIKLDYTPLVNVRHVFDEEALNNVREVAEEGTPKAQVIVNRTRALLQSLLQTDFGTVLFVCHGANTKHAEAILQEGLHNNLRISGERSVGSWALFRPVDDARADGPWFAPGGVWNQGLDDPLSPR